MGQDAGDPSPDTATVAGPSPAAAAERKVGAYRILRELGHGGMGTVFLAVRADDQYQKRVALKVVRGLDSAEVVARFRRERQILAALDHPNIARLLDGGVTEDGLPYFVMEHVEGLPIDRYCDEQTLPPAARLRLFLGVCAAVQYAHRNLVVHRDLKPANILVTTEGVPKLLDFGIAKFLNPDLGLEAPTGTALVMTPEYASPEQVRGTPVTTASDVYSLGVILYELLTGHRPYRLASLDPLDVLKAVCEAEPERPSTAVGRREEQLLTGGRHVTTTPAGVSRARDSTPERLRRRLRGDLDNIVLMALRKESQRRYGSVEALANDLRRHLEGLPVSARKSTAWYRVSKFAQRNASGVAFVAALFALTLGFALVTALQARRVSRERDRAERLASFMVDLFQVADPSDPRSGATTARDVLDKGLEAIAHELDEDPETRARLLETMGQAYRGLGLYGQARQPLEEALRLRRRPFPNQRTELVSCLTALAAVLADQGDYQGAEPLYREALAIRRSLHGQEHSEVAASLQDLAVLLYEKGDYAGSEPLYVESLEMQRRLLGNEHRAVARGLNNLAILLDEQGRYAEAERLCREALAIRRKLLTPDDPGVATGLHNLAEVLRHRGELVAAEALYRDALDIYRKRLGQDHPTTTFPLTGLALVLADGGQASKAEPLARLALDIRLQKLAPDHMYVAEARGVLGYCLLQLGRTRQAAPLLESAYAGLAARPRASRMRRDAAQRLAALYRAVGRVDEAHRLEVELAAPVGAPGPASL